MLFLFKDKTLSLQGMKKIVKNSIIAIAAIAVVATVVVAKIDKSKNQNQKSDDATVVDHPTAENYEQYPHFDKEYSENEAESTILYGIDSRNYTVSKQSVGNGQTVGGILGKAGVSAVKIDRLDKVAKEVFPLRKIRAGNNYTTFTRSTTDSLGTHEVLDYMVYHINTIDYVVFDFTGEEPTVTLHQMPIELQRKRCEAVITSSLWGSIMEKGLPYALAAEFEDIYQWTVDFFGIQNGDSFAVIYDDKVVDGKSVGIGRIWGAKFVHNGKTYYAIPYAQDGVKVSYWEANGESLRKQMLKAPLKYTRISSRFSHSRLHPVHKVYRPHHGVDYAAPMGTPVHSVADGTVVFAGWGGGGGNTIKIKHAGGLQTGYLHLKSFAKGIKVGKYVSQGDLIGYVGSTGTSTGPHLDYRIWKNGTPVDPLKLTQEPAEPINAAHKAQFEALRDRVVAELEGAAEGTYTPITEDDIYGRTTVTTAE